ncbi:nuclear transport factor 2 family protein [Saccharothrix sp. NPDC042600]|uniref:nuclear transport factor 2 family protein n=1 Tax=Saccharothrix TaxID=2071 RepID=UPI0033C55159|nr:hypothetical protein GCM10017745_58180 [Saccharothrix mutabilis subsp. capreolus]
MESKSVPTKPAPSGPTAAEVLQRYRTAVESGDLELAKTTLADDVVVRSPITSRYGFTGPQHIRELTSALASLDDFRLTGQVSDDRSALFSYSGRVRGVPIDHAIHVRLDDQPRIKEIVVFIRPLPAAITFMGAIGQDLARAHGKPGMARVVGLSKAVLGGLVRFNDRVVVPLVLRGLRAF